MTKLQNAFPDELQAELDKMPMHYTIRAYRCEHCDTIHSEVVQRKETKRRKKCPSCKKHKLQAWICQVAVGIIQKDITTLGQQAERNTKKMGRYGKQKADREQAEAKGKAKREALRQMKNMPKGMTVPEPLEESPTFGKDLAKRRRLMNMDRKQLGHYIKTGKEKK